MAADRVVLNPSHADLREEGVKSYFLNYSLSKLHLEIFGES